MAISDYSKTDFSFPSIHFNPKQLSKPHLSTQIMLTITVNGSRLRVYTGIRIEPVYWSRHSQRCIIPETKNKRLLKFLSRANVVLDSIEQSIVSADLAVAAKGQHLTLPDLRQAILTVRSDSEVNVKPIAYFRKVADQFASNINRRGVIGRSSSSKTYHNAIDRLERFCKAEGIGLESFDEMDKNFFDRFYSSLYNNRCKTCGQEQAYSLNTIVNTVKVIKNLLHRAYDDELTTNDSFRRVQTLLPSDISNKVYLNETELAKLMKYQSDNLRMNQVRDLFMIASWTSLRMSDVLKLNQAEFSNESITLIQQKTKNKVCIPMLKEIRPIIDRYSESGDGFPVVSQQYMNNAIKKIAMESGITSIVTYKENRGGQVIVQSVPKWKLVSFHTARRSCLTNLYKRGYSINYLMSISGHKSIQAIQRYIRSSQKEMSEEFLRLLKKDGAV